MATFPTEVLVNILPCLQVDTFVKLYPMYKSIIETPYMLGILCEHNNLPMCSTAVEYVSYLSTLTGNIKYECMGMIDRMLRAINIDNPHVFKRLLDEGGKVNKKIVLAMGRKHPTFLQYVPVNMVTLYRIGMISSSAETESSDYKNYIDRYYMEIAEEACISGRLDILVDVLATRNMWTTSCLNRALEYDQREIIKYLCQLNLPEDCLREIVSCHNMWALEYLDSVTDLSKLGSYNSVISRLSQDLDIALYLDNKYDLISWKDVLNIAKEDAKLIEYAVKHSNPSGSELRNMMMVCSQNGYLSSFIFLHTYLGLDPRETLKKISPIVITRAGMHTHSYLWLQLQVSK